MTSQASDRLDHVTIRDESAYTALIAYNLPVLRVEQQRPTGPRCIIWRNEPSPEDAAKAISLIGAAEHAW